MNPPQLFKRMVQDAEYPIDRWLISEYVDALRKMKFYDKNLMIKTIAGKAIEIIREAKQSDVEISMRWNKGDRIPHGFMECRPGPHIRRIAAINTDTDIDGRLRIGYKPFVEENEIAEYSIGNPTPTIIIGPTAHSSEHEPVLNLLVTRAKSGNPISC